MSNPAWDMLRAQFKPDAKGRFKTTQAMQIASQLAAENEKLRQLVDELVAERSGK